MGSSPRANYLALVEGLLFARAMLSALGEGLHPADLGGPPSPRALDFAIGEGFFFFFFFSSSLKYSHNNHHIHIISITGI
jgi:fatty acid desaturase